MAGKNSVFVDNSPPSVDSTWLNLNQNEQNNLITGTGQSLSDAINNQQAISASRFAGNNFYIDSGTANAYILTLAASMTNPVSATVGYYVGMTIRFRAGNANTGASTVNVNGAGVKNLKQTDGVTDLNPNQLSTSQDVIFRYDGTAFVFVSYVPTNYLFSPSFRNVIINGGMQIDQRNAGNSQTITAAAALAYTIDRWYAYCTGANVTGQQVAGTSPNAYNYRFTGAASVTKIGFAQRIESANCQFLANNTATLSVDLANSLLTTVTWVAYYANTNNTFGSLASPTRTQIATGTFTVSSTLTRYSTNISIPSAATTGIEIEFSVGAQTSGTWTIGRVQLEAGSYATPFENKPIQDILLLCQRYYRKSYNYSDLPGSSAAAAALGFLTGLNSCADIYSYGNPMFATPIVRYWDLVGNLSKVTANGVNNTSISTGAIASESKHLYIDVSLTVATDKTMKFQFDATSEL